MCEAGGIANLPAEIRVAICLWLDSLNDLLQLSGVSHSFRTIFLCDESLWLSVLSGTPAGSGGELCHLAADLTLKAQEIWNIHNLSQSFIEHSRNARAMRLLSLRPFTLPPEPHFYRDLYQNLREYHSDFLSPDSFNVFRVTRAEPILFSIARELMQQQPLMVISSCYRTKMNFNSEWQLRERDETAPYPPLQSLPFAYGVRDTDEGQNYVDLEFSVGFPGRSSSWLYAALVDPADNDRLRETMQGFVFVSLAYHNNYEHASTIWFRRHPKYVALPWRGSVSEIISGAQRLIDEYVEIVSRGQIHTDNGGGAFEYRNARRVLSHLKTSEKVAKQLQSLGNDALEAAARAQLQELAPDLRNSRRNLVSFWDSICFSSSLKPKRERKMPSKSPIAALMRCTRRACCFLLLPKLKTHYSCSSWKDESKLRCLYWGFVLGSNELTKYRKFPPTEPGVASTRARLQSMMGAVGTMDTNSSNFSSWPLWAYDLFNRIAAPVAKVCFDAAVSAMTSQQLQGPQDLLESLDFEDLIKFLRTQIDEARLADFFDPKAPKTS